MAQDLTIIHYTANHLDRVNPEFAEKVREQILKSAGEYPIISVSHKPMNFGENICIGEQPRSHLNIYRAILIGSKHAKTPYVGMAEDDVLAPPSHWRTHRPPPDRFAYDLNRWGINTWVEPPTYGYRNRPVVNQLIAPTAMLVDALEERFEKFAGKPESEIPLSYWGDPGRYEKQLGVSKRELECFAAPDPSVVFSHEEAFGFLNHGKRKSVGQFPRSWLPYWGFAHQMLALYKQSESELATAHA